jgi:hypothetical protein
MARWMAMGRPGATVPMGKASEFSRRIDQHLAFVPDTESWQNLQPEVNDLRTGTC